MKKEEGTLADRAKSKGAVGFLPSESAKYHLLLFISSYSQLAPLSFSYFVLLFRSPSYSEYNALLTLTFSYTQTITRSAQQTHAKEGEKGKDVVEMAKAKGAVGFLSFENDSKLSIPKVKDTDRSASPSLLRRNEAGVARRGDNDIRDIAKAGGAVGFLSVDSAGGTHQNVLGGGSVSPSPIRPALSPQIRPREGVTDIRDFAKSKGAVGFLSFNDDGESQPPHTATDLNPGKPSQQAKSQGALGFMAFSDSPRSEIRYIFGRTIF